MMDQYATTSYALAEMLTKRYSTSFSMSSRLFDAAIRPHIYAIYGLVRVADEIVDTYDGDDKQELLDSLEVETKRAIHSGYSTNPIVHAFALSARIYGIDDELLRPFFASMRVDIAQKQFTRKQYQRYIYGSAEVVGLMCLRVFVKNDEQQYAQLRDGACALGAAYQKVNFLRDMQADYDERGRVYFPGLRYVDFDDTHKAAIVADIRHDFARSEESLSQLPASARTAVRASFYYYGALLDELDGRSAREVIARRIRVANWRKVWLLMKAWVNG